MYEDESEDDGEDEVAFELASLAEAAASSCRKCPKEIKTGEKTMKVHTDHCPRKRRNVAAMDESEDESDEEEVHGKGRAWTAEEDKELGKRVRLHGEGSWSAILDNSCIFRERYETWSSVKNARQCIKARWSIILKKSWKDNANSDEEEEVHGKGGALSSVSVYMATAAGKPYWTTPVSFKSDMKPHLVRSS